ncbi:MAG: methyltransferase [Zoogloea sp.]|uniref:methyltransferase n=1 Tax=Zoogloea sp. TaxID=49181 RepID=UPI0026177283|nr:methyltransferase [Zoogloea sp.]MDD2991057.1 methyltransferase [Zoogloea sp.]
MQHRQRFLQIQHLLEHHEALWRPSPFYQPRPTWCEMHPDLSAALLSLDEDRVNHLAADPVASRQWLAGWLPIVKELPTLETLPPLPARTRPAAGVHFDWSIPGRKRQQIEAFANHVPATTAPLLEWCAGKGHLGRRLALADNRAVHSLEIDAGLCADGRHLATRARANQTLICGDALAPESRDHVPGREVLALHACGELHRHLVRHAATDGARGYRIAPCCYYRGAQEGYRPLNQDARLAMDGGALRLAVTETVTAPQRLRQRLARDQAWKQGLIALRNSLEGEAVRPYPPMPTHLLSGDFIRYGEAVARRQGLVLPARVDWEHWLAVGEARRQEVRRLELVRHTFRQCLELWLVLDIALGLEEAGFEVTLGHFCDRYLTPRNLLISAERQR